MGDGLGVLIDYPLCTGIFLSLPSETLLSGRPGEDKTSIYFVLTVVHTYPCGHLLLLIVELMLFTRQVPLSRYAVVLLDHCLALCF